MTNVLIYCEKSSSRLDYILRFFWKDRCTLTLDLAYFEAADLPKIFFGENTPNLACIHIPASDILFEKNIRQQDIRIGHWQELPIFFRGNGNIPFDLFGAAFYLLSRYEEYLPHEKDIFGRYAEWNSLAYKNHFLQIPLIDYWFLHLENILVNLFPHYQKQKHTFSYQPTFDIDIPYAFLHKSLAVQIGGLGKDILKMNWKQIGLRLQVLSHKAKDPFDNFDMLEAQIASLSFNPVFFIPVAANHGKYDKNPPQYDKHFQKLILHLSQHFTIGMHPSCQSGDHPEYFPQEKHYLETISEKKITHSRQHFIRMVLPDTYRQLIEQGIEQDYSMGYGHANGFRASTSRTFYWYDIRAEKTTVLLIHPFCWMDATAYHHQKDRPEKVLEDLLSLKKMITTIQGKMITVMHNNYFATTPDMVAYREKILAFWHSFVH